MDVPIKMLRNVIVEILEERSACIEIEAETQANEELEEIGVISETSSEIGWTAAGARALADDIKAGIISIDDSLSSLTRFERQELVKRCQNLLESSRRKDHIK